jgi:hypothetical protein
MLPLRAKYTCTVPPDINVTLSHDSDIPFPITQTHLGEQRVTPSDVRISFASSASQLLAISIWDDEDSKALAKTYGAVAFLDKTTLGTNLIPAIKRSL